MSYCVDSNITCLLNKLCKSCHVNLLERQDVILSRDPNTINKGVVFVSIYVIKYS